MSTTPDFRTRPGTRPGTRFEWPTLLLALLIHAGWLCLTLMATRISWCFLPIAGGWITAWHLSLQHELIHDHPSHTRWINTVLGSVPISPWLPYLRYRDSHLAHHRAGVLTDPLEDPESFYLPPSTAASRSAFARGVARAHNTLAGRLLLGPFMGCTGFLAEEAIALWRNTPGTRRAWLLHLPGLALVTAWLTLACHLSLLTYLWAFVLPGYSLSLLRSFAEHEAAEDPAHRTAIVERAPVLGVLFLFNNLHLVHHLRPDLAWYRLPRAYHADRALWLARNGGLVYRGYLDVARRFLLREHHAPEHPSARTGVPGAAETA